MTEIKCLITGSEIEMLQDLMNPNSKTTIENLSTKWGCELHNLLKTLGHIVSAPGFEIETLKEQYKKCS